MWYRRFPVVDVCSIKGTTPHLPPMQSSPDFSTVSSNACTIFAPKTFRCICMFAPNLQGTEAERRVSDYGFHVSVSTCEVEFRWYSIGLDRVIRRVMRPNFYFFISTQNVTTFLYIYTPAFLDVELLTSLWSTRFNLLCFPAKNKIQVIDPFNFAKAFQLDVWLSLAVSLVLLPAVCWIITRQVPWSLFGLNLNKIYHSVA